MRHRTSSVMACFESRLGVAPAQSWTDFSASSVGDKGTPSGHWISRSVTSQATFRGWLNLSLSEKSEDLRDYLRALDEPQDEVVQHWLQSKAYRSYVPAGVIKAETDLFCQDLETLLELLKNEAIRRQSRSGADARDQGSLPPA